MSRCICKGGAEPLALELLQKCCSALACAKRFCQQLAIPLVRDGRWRAKRDVIVQLEEQRNVIAHPWVGDKLEPLTDATHGANR